MDLFNAKIYVGTYGKYVDGSIDGAWLDLVEYEDKEDFIGACKELHKDEAEPELMFQDWECIPDDLIGESWLSKEFFELRNAIAELDLNEREALGAWLRYSDYSIGKNGSNELIDAFREQYVGGYDSEEDFAYEVIEECYELPEFARSYFDYEKFSRDLFMGDYWYDNGYVFRNN